MLILFDRTQNLLPTRKLESTNTQPIQPIRSPPPIQPIRSPQTIQPIRSPPLIQAIRSPPPIQPIRSPQTIQPIRSPQTIKPIRSPPLIQPIRSQILLPMKTLDSIPTDLLGIHSIAIFFPHEIHICWLIKNLEHIRQNKYFNEEIIK